MGEVPAETELSRNIVKGPQGAGLQILRADDRLCLHAGDRHGQRPSDRLPPPRGLREALAARLALRAARIGAARISALFLDLPLRFRMRTEPDPFTALFRTPPLVAAALVAEAS